MFSKKCKKHLAEVNESGLQHMIVALTVAIKFQLLVPALIVHSIVPGLFTHTATEVIKRILQDRR